MNIEQSFLDLVKVGSYQLFHRERRGAIWGRQSGMSETEMDESFQGFLFWVCRVSFCLGWILSCRGHERWTSASCMGFLFWFFWVFRDRDERKFTGLSFLDFQDFLLYKREMGGKFQRFFFWLFRFFFSVRVRDGRHSPGLVLSFSEFPFLEGKEMDDSFPRFLQGPPCYRWEIWTRGFRVF